MLSSENIADAGKPLSYCIAVDSSLVTYRYVQLPYFRQQTCFVVCSLVAVEQF